MRAQDAIGAMFILILVYLLVVNWRGASQLLVAGGSALMGMTKTLQGR